jgi:hypothetical protein
MGCEDGEWMELAQNQLELRAFGNNGVGLGFLTPL